MNSEQSEILASRLNQSGVLVRYEVNGVQHEFILNIKDLLPTSPIFTKNRENIRDTEYTLLPGRMAAPIKSEGKRLFDPEYARVNDISKKS
jgi:hypothetical protein